MIEEFIGLMGPIGPISPMSHFLEVLNSGHVLLMDGAMGTQLQRAGISEGECYEHWNLTHPDQVRAIHQGYVNAGADCLLTNTFQANLAALARHGLQDQLETIHQAAMQLARSAAGPERFVLADIGPLGNTMALNSITRMLPSLGSADALLLETCSNLGDLDRLLRIPKQKIPILLSFTYRRTSEGKLQPSPEKVARQAADYTIAALGVNCGRGIGMGEVIDIIRRYRQVTDGPLFARPNAGTPIHARGRWIYPHPPKEMAGRLPELLEAGVAMIGGCCGTTPEHIAAFRPIIDDWNASACKRGENK